MQPVSAGIQAAMVLELVEKWNTFHTLKIKHENVKGIKMLELLNNILFQVTSSRPDKFQPMSAGGEIFLNILFHLGEPTDSSEMSCHNVTDPVSVSLLPTVVLNQ